MEYVLPAVLGGLLLFALGSVFISLLRVLTRWHHNKRQPVQTLRARLVRKEQHDRLLGGGGRTWSGWSTYSATFELADTRECLSFSVRPALYATLGEPRIAILTYQGTRFLGFGTEADEEAESPTRPQDVGGVDTRAAGG